MLNNLYAIIYTILHAPRILLQGCLIQSHWYKFLANNKYINISFHFHM